MIQLLGSLFLKFDQLLSLAFDSIDNRPPIKKLQVILPLDQPKNKWQLREEKRLRRQQEREERLRARTMLEIARKEQCAEEKSNETAATCRIRQNLQVNNRVIKEIERKRFVEIKQSLNLKLTSFLLPDYISISDHSYLNENSLKIIYGLLLVEFEARSKKCKDTMSHSSSSENLSKEESVSILKGKISLFPGVLRQKMVRPLPEFLKKLESRLSTSKTAMEIKKKLSKDEEELQSILKQLRKAKINRYQLNLHVQNLIGRYLMLKRKYPSQGQVELELKLQEFELSDIGLFSQSLQVEPNEEFEIMQYWHIKNIQSFLPSHSRYEKYLQKIISHLHINSQMQLDLNTYLQLLHKFEARLILVEQTRARNEIAYKRKELAKAQKQFKTIFASSTVYKSKQWTKKKLSLPAPLFSQSTSLRLFKKWRSFDKEDGLSASSMMLTLISKEITYDQAFQMLLKDYDTQLVIPRNQFISDLLETAASYRELTKELLEEEEKKKKFRSMSRQKNPEKSLKIVTLQTPAKKIAKGTKQQIDLISLRSESMNARESDSENESESENEKESDSQSELPVEEIDASESKNVSPYNGISQNERSNLKLQDHQFYEIENQQHMAQSQSNPFFPFPLFEDHDSMDDIGQGCISGQDSLLNQLSEESESVVYQ